MLGKDNKLITRYKDIVSALVSKKGIIFWSIPNRYNINYDTLLLGNLGPIIALII